MATDSDLQRASGLWLKDGKRGKFMSGETSIAIPAGAKVLVFKNDRKREGQNDPDYTLCFIDGADQPPMRRAEPGQYAEPQPPAVDDDRNIPF